MDSKYVIVTAAITALYTLLHIFEKDFRKAGVITGFVILMLFLITGVVKLIGKNLKLEKVLVFIMLLDIIISGTYLMNGNFGSNSNLTRDADYINKLTDEYSELTEPFSGSVFLNNSNYNLAAMTDTQSPVYFYSGASVYTLNMYTKYNIYHSLNTIYYGTGNPFADMMMHTKYHMADAYNGNAQTWYPNVATVNNMNVYENPYYLPLGFMTDSDTTAKLTQWDTSKATYRDLFDYQNAFSQQITGKDFYNKIEINEINNIIETLPQEAVTDEQKDEEAGKDADAGSMDNPDASTMDNADEKSDKSSNNKLTGPDKIQSLNPLLNQTPDQMTNQNSDQPANQAADQTMEISIPDDISYFEIGPAEDASTNQLTVYNIPVYIHINASTIKPGEYYVSMRDYIMYLGNINDKDVDITITIPTHELFSDKSLIDSFAIAKLDNEAFTKVHDILATTTLTDITNKAGTINAALNNSEVGRLYISLPYSKNWEIKVDGKAVKAYVYLGGTGVDIPAGNHKIEMVYHTSGAYEGLIISIGTILILLLVIIYIKRKKTTDSE